MNDTGVTMIGDVCRASFQDRKLASRPYPHISTASDARGEESRLTSRALRCARAGDRQALEYLYARYADDVYEHVRPLLGDDHEAADVTRQVFAGMRDSIGRYEEQDVPLRTWILHVSRDLALDRARRRSRPYPQRPDPRIVTV